MSDCSNMLGYTNCFERHSEKQSVLIQGSIGTIKPLVSVMIPTYRRPKLLREAIASALAQDTSLAFEVVVVDNESDPVMAEEVDNVVRSFEASNLYLYRNEINIGMFGNWNRCIELAKSEWISILNDDDLLKPGFLQAVLQAKFGESMVACGVECFGNKLPASSNQKKTLRTIYRYLTKICFYKNGVRQLSAADALKGNPVHAALGVLFSKKKAIALGGYNEKYWPIADYVFNVKYWFDFGALMLADNLALCRFEENESLKIKTIEGFIIQGNKFKLDIIESLPVGDIYKKILNFIASIQIKLDASRHQLLYNDKFNAESVLSSLGYSFSGLRLVILRHRLLGYLWRLLAGTIKTANYTKS